MTVTQKAIGGGAIAGITIGACVCCIILAVGGKKGYDLYEDKWRGKVFVNPFYESRHNTTVNPEYIDDQGLAEHLEMAD